MIKIGLHQVQKIEHKLELGEIFKRPHSTILNGPYTYQDQLNGYHFFSSKYIPFRGSINWHQNYYNNRISNNEDSNWWSILDFDESLGDIKTVWELSRFSWIIFMIMSDNPNPNQVLEDINMRINDWILKNPPYKGINWKCGQETSIRVLNLVYGLMLLDQINSPSKELISLIEMHLKRILPTLSYAIAQDNNHGVSEAAALFIGGHLLYKNGYKNYIRHYKLGEQKLKERACTLFTEEGCFSQYSTNYHRMVLDIYSLCESYRRKQRLPPFSDTLIKKISKAIQWLEVLVNEKNGRVPNLGSNDGALLFNFFNSKYEDFRPSIQIANLLFLNRHIYKMSKLQKDVYTRIGVDFSKVKSGRLITKALIEGNEGGIMIYKNKNILLLFRRPIFKFRPSQSDVFHTDLWIDGKNILRDGGTYSYNTSVERLNYYSGDFSHNTIWFNNQSKMQKLSRFLFLNWLQEKTFKINNNTDLIEFSSSYSIGKNTHKRSILLQKNELYIRDTLKLNSAIATINWRLENIAWRHLKEHSKDLITINLNNNTIHGTVIKTLEKESLVYLDESDLVTIQRNFHKSTQFNTKITW